MKSSFDLAVDFTISIDWEELADEDLALNQDIIQEGGKVFCARD